MQHLTIISVTRSVGIHTPFPWPCYSGTKADDKNENKFMRRAVINEGLGNEELMKFFIPRQRRLHIQQTHFTLLTTPEFFLPKKRESIKKNKNLIMQKQK